MWRIRTLREERGITQAELAKRIGAFAQTLGRWEMGQRRVPREALEKIAEALGVGVPDLVEPGTENMVAPPRAPRPLSSPAQALIAHLAPASAQGLPVVGANRHGALAIDRAAPLERVPCPPQLQNVPGAFAVYMVGAGMAPLLEPGWLLYCSPRPPHPGQPALAERQDGTALVGIYRGESPEELRLEELQPPRAITLRQDDVAALYSIAGVWLA